MLKKSASRGGWPGESPVLAQRAVSEDPRWTRAVGGLIRAIRRQRMEAPSQVARWASLIGLFERPADVLCPYPIHTDHRNSAVPKMFFRSLLGRLLIGRGACESPRLPVEAEIGTLVDQEPEDDLTQTTLMFR